ncbi:branched-chain amino acid ABC transporter permease [Roseitranquillus sediminis]|uniref:branched-chain amino acid ABC transporter permease n=1 Tax=Roseitranquillus sediminis TaxID=2809051 RepID=UPI001D0C31D6|nr:branched-chain amino acid ABC transporter permease [Roseitranquillus sediminis]MBM9593966.1 branched-chain amino acid ABC transporter permease [Roseitranquillus sediminis]
MIWVETVMQGVTLGGLYALFAAGLYLVLGVMRLANLAHGAFIVLAAYVILLLASLLEIGPLLAALIAAPALFAAGWLLQRLLLNRLLGEDILPPLLVTLGLSIVIQTGLEKGLSAQSRRISPGPLETATVEVGPAVVSLLPLLSLGSAVLVVLVLQWVALRTATGRALRAISDDPATASMVGISPPRLLAGVTGVSLVVATIAALHAGTLAEFQPASGTAYLIIAFEAVLIGGLGSPWGALAGGIVLGVAQTAGAALDPEWEVLAGHVAFLAVLLVRPRGLFPRASG